MLFLVTILSTFSHLHAEAFEARVIVASTHERLALVSLSSKDTMVFGQCVLPAYYEPARDLGAPLEAFMNCAQVGETLPNKADVRAKLETAFRKKFGETFDAMTGASVGTIARSSALMGAAGGAIFTSLISFASPKLGLLTRGAIFAGSSGALSLATAVIAGRKAYAKKGSAEVLGQINRSQVLTALKPPLVIEDISELGLVSRRGFKLARTALTDAVQAVAFELRGIVPGGGSAGGAGTSATW